MAAARLSKRYAKSLIGLAREEEILEQITSDVEGLIEAIEGNRELRRLLKSPIVKGDVKKRIFEKAFGSDAQKMTMAFLRIVIRKRRERYLLSILHAFKQQYNELKGIVPVTVTSAVELEEKEEREFSELLRQEFNKPTIELSKEVDEEIIGGFVLEFDNKRYDASVKRQLEEIKKNFHKQGSLKIS